MQRFAPHLGRLAGQSESMAKMVREWVRIRSGSHDVDGLAELARKLKKAFAVLGGTMEEIELPPLETIDSLGRTCAMPLGKALRFRKRPNAPLQVFLGIHTDVVYGDGDHDGAEGPEGGKGGTGDGDVTSVLREENGRLYASGAADAKGGIAILLKALETFEASPFCTEVGWEILLNPDEELGSPGSRHLLAQAASRNHLGLLFEPCLPDGNLVGERKGSGNFTAVMRGRSAHAGRDPEAGRNAVHALAEAVVALHRFGKTHPGVNVNVAKLEGGGPSNRVPDLALARFNLRVATATQQAEALGYLKELEKEFSGREGYGLEISGGFASPPKPVTAEYESLLMAVRSCGDRLGMELHWRPSGGVSDGNKLAAAGLPNVDTLGAHGGNIHSTGEFLIWDSLVERAKLTALLLMRLGTGDIVWPLGRE